MNGAGNPCPCPDRAVPVASRLPRRRDGCLRRLWSALLVSAAALGAEPQIEQIVVTLGTPPRVLAATQAEWTDRTLSQVYVRVT